MLKKLLLGIGAALSLLVLVISLQPSTFHVERSITIGAPPAQVAALVNDFHAWRGWSPWEKLDPGMQRRYDGAPAGVGAKYAWVGSKQVGEGRMSIEQSDASRTRIELEFLKPFRATNTVSFSFANSPEGTRTTWAMDGSRDFMAKAMHLVMDMDQLVGSDFERGLSALKLAAEASAPSTSLAKSP